MTYVSLSNDGMLCLCMCVYNIYFLNYVLLLFFQITVASTWTIEDFKSFIEPSSGSFTISDINLQVPGFCCSLSLSLFQSLLPGRHVLKLRRRKK